MPDTAPTTVDELADADPAELTGHHREAWYALLADARARLTRNEEPTTA